LPGITLHYILRKKYIEEQTRKAIDEGATQIVNLGAGFDTLCWRLHKQHPHVNFIEIDHPDTHKLKYRALASKAEQTDNMHFLSVDFNDQDLKSALSNFDKFDQSKPTLYICEGVMMYLTEEEIGHMFDAIRSMTGKGSQLLFTALEPKESPNNNTRKLLYIFLNLISEPLKWEKNSEQIPTFLNAHQCTMKARAATPTLQKNYLNPDIPATLHHGEYLVLASFD
jgi:methyltransferase (TIGR00027 family)